MRIGFMTDLHYRDAVPGTARIARRECRRMAEVLDRTLDALVAAGADLIVCAGDCVDTADHPAVLDDLAALRDRFAATSLPAIVIPGNHDPAPADFYRRLPQPPRRQRLGDCEFIAFYDDVCDPGSEQSSRSDERLRWMRETLREQPSGVALTFSIQHFVVFPEHQGPGYRHTYANDEAIRGILEGSPRRLVVLSGHMHGGSPLTTHRGVTYFTGRALCERPFPYYLIDTGALDGRPGIRVRSCTLEPSPVEAQEVEGPGTAAT